MASSGYNPYVNYYGYSRPTVVHTNPDDWRRYVIPSYIPSAEDYTIRLTVTADDIETASEPEEEERDPYRRCVINSTMPAGFYPPTRQGNVHDAPFYAEQNRRRTSILSIPPYLGTIPTNAEQA